MTFLIAGIVLLAVFTQAVTGFGLALVSMGLLAQTLGVQVAAPLIALTAAPLELIVLVRHRRSLNLSAVWRLALGSMIGIPIGLLGVRYLNEKVVLVVLGVVIIAYALYALRTPKLPELKESGWAYGFGFLAGILGGAYNTAGPPTVLYGSSRQWSPAEFKTNLQGFFCSTMCWSSWVTP